LLRRLSPMTGLFFLMAAGFLWGAFQLFVLRFESGDIYPAYSSLRSDPVGIRAFYESLKTIDSLSVRRHYQSLSRIKSGKGVTLFFLGAKPFLLSSYNKEFPASFNRLLLTGARIVIALHPSSVTWPIYPEKKEGKIHPRLASWDIAFRYFKASSAEKTARLASPVQNLDLPPSVLWHSNIYFDVSDDFWRVYYAKAQRPVMVERAYGRGQIILLSDTYLFSNEALRRERHPEWLTLLTGTNATIIFNEAHLGISKTSGVAPLARKYRMQWLLGALLFLAILFIWKNSVYFVPPPDESQMRNRVDSRQMKTKMTKDDVQGLVSILRRNIPSREILRLCVDEWKQGDYVNRRISTGKLKQVDTVMDATLKLSEKDTNVVGIYRKIYKIVSEDFRL